MIKNESDKDHKKNDGLVPECSNVKQTEEIFMVSYDGKHVDKIKVRGFRGY